MLALTGMLEPTRAGACTKTAKRGVPASAACRPARSGKKGTQPVPDNTSGAWDLIAVPWHLDEHIPDFPVPVGTVATIGPPLPDCAVPSRVTVLHRAVADAVAGTARPLTQG
jgi:hypothetical protein